MSGGEGVNISAHDLHLVQHRVERCLQHYMHKREAMNSLAINDNIDPTFTELIWQRLEEQNPEFFKAYYLKLLVKDQIMEYNRLLSEQVELMRRIGIDGGASTVRSSNGSHASPLQPLPTSPTAQSSRLPKTECNIMQQQENMFVGRASSVHPSTTVQATFDDSVSPSLFFPHDPNVGLAQPSNGHFPRAEANYDASLQFNFSPHGNLMEPRPMIVDACMPSFSGGGDMTNLHHHHHLNDNLLSGDCSSFGFLPQIPPNLSFSELAAADFPGTSELLESYSRPQFMAPEANGFADPNEDMERLDPQGGNLRYHSLGGD